MTILAETTLREEGRDQIDIEVIEERRDRKKWRHFLTLVSAFLINFTACGLDFSFGVYQALYESMAKQDDNPFSGASPADIDLIGTLCTSLMTIGALFAVAWAKNFNPQAVVCTGGLLFGSGCVAASFSKSLWHFQLSQGLLLGIGTCLSFVPSMTAAPTWFDEHRGLAMGIISSGTGIGGLVWAPVIAACIENMGYRNTLRLTGALSSLLICTSSSFLDWEPSMATKMHAESTTTSKTEGAFRIPLPSIKLVKQRRFIAQALSAALQSAAYYIPVFFTVTYAQVVGYSAGEGANITAGSNACNAIGKISVGLIADRVGRLNLFFLTTLLSAVAALSLWIPSAIIGPANEASARALFVSFTILYSLSASAYVSLFPAVLVELFGIQQLPHVAGIMYMVQGMAAMIGIPVAGLLVRHQGKTETSNIYVGMAALTASLMFAAAAAVAWARLEAMRDRDSGVWAWRWKQ